MTPLFNRIVVVGLGQIGTSLALALKRTRLCRELVAVDINRRHLTIARQRGIQCYRRFNLAKADLVILAVPVRSICNSLNILRPGPLVMDVGSTKSHQAMIARAKKLRYIGAHPIAGTEKSGPEAGNPRLFEGRICFLSGPRKNSADHCLIERLWKRVGAKVRWIDPKRHDALFAKISHLPHAVSFSFARGVIPRLRNEKIRSWVEGSFRDMTRVSSSPAEMWTDIFLDNRKNLLPLLDRLIDEFSRFRQMVRTERRLPLRRWLQGARRLKEGLR